MKEWFSLSVSDRREAIIQTSIEKGLPAAAIEKDWWVVTVLRAIFSTVYTEHLVFKGGTSLSKAWGVIERFSEDIDLAMDRSFFGFSGTLNRTKVSHLRKASCKFASEVFPKELAKTLHAQNVGEFSIEVREFVLSDTDPLAIEIHYKSLVEHIDYLAPRILVEISSRSLRDPFEKKGIISFIGAKYNGQPFADEIIYIPTVLPTRTFLEKLFLLHEEFQKPENREIFSERMTRHLYDISRLMDTPFGESALIDSHLYSNIIQHRKIFTKVSWVDYSKHAKRTLDFIPPDRAMKDWERDYVAMQESMFYGKTEPFDELMNKLRGLRDRINKMES